MNGPLWTKGWEGCRLTAYDDSTGETVPFGSLPKGVLTIGYGHAGHDVQPGAIWTQAQADQAFQADYSLAIDNALRAAGHGVQPLGDARWSVLADMAFQMGLGGLEGFTDMLSALRAGDWISAGTQCLDSKYAHTDSPRRARANAQMLLTGVWPEVHPNNPTIS